MLLITFIVATTLGVLLGLVVYLTNYKLTQDRETLSVFECGFITLRNSPIPFRIRFYLVAIIFLIFDLEIIIMFPFS